MENYDDPYAGTILGLGIGIFLLIFVLYIALYIWAIWALVVKSKTLPSWATAVGVILLLLGIPFGTLILVYVVPPKEKA